MNSKMVFWHVDSGHAWLQVPKESIARHGLEDKISGYSYHSGYYAYLEEDCDAWIYLRAVFSNEWLNENCRLIPRQRYEGDAPCRSFRPFFAGCVDEHKIQVAH